MAKKGMGFDYRRDLILPEDIFGRVKTNEHGIANVGQQEESEGGNKCVSRRWGFGGDEIGRGDVRYVKKKKKIEGFYDTMKSLRDKDNFCVAWWLFSLIYISIYTSYKELNIL